MAVLALLAICGMQCTDSACLYSDGRNYIFTAGVMVDIEIPPYSAESSRLELLLCTKQLIWSGTNLFFN